MRFKHFKGDIYGGLVAGVIALPLALAFGIQSGLGANAGLMCAIVLGFFAAILGGTPAQVSGPTGPMTVISAVVVMTAIEAYGDLNSSLGIIISTFFLAGCLQILLGVFKLGSYIRFIPQPVISGFMSGIGIIIILLQIYPLFGHPSPTSTIKVLLDIAKPLSAINYQALMLGALSLAIIFGLKRWDKIFPSTITALIVLTVIATLFKFDVPTIGQLPSSFHLIKLSNIFSFDKSHLYFIIVSAITLAGLGAIDSLLTSVIADQITGSTHNSNRELIGQGIGNALCALVGGFPGAGATMRTVGNIKIGGRTRLSGALHSIVLLLIILVFGQYVANIPIAVLAAILLNIGIGIIDYRSFKILFAIPLADRLILITVLLLTVFTNLIHAIAAGMILVAFLLLKQFYEISHEKTKSGHIQQFFHEIGCDELCQDLDKLNEYVYVKFLHGPIFWGLPRELNHLLAEDGNIKHFAIYIDSLDYLDQSGYYALESTIKRCHALGIEVHLINLHQQPKSILLKTNLIPELIGEDHLYDSFEPFIASLLKAV